ncbi:Serine/threonine kinase mps1 [Dispira simplex]|nr:Serine/threonine kinase mps1 [Dispira simplex]
MSQTTPAASKPAKGLEPRTTASKNSRWKRGRIGLGPPVRSLPVGGDTEGNLDIADEGFGLGKTMTDDLGLDWRLDSETTPEHITPIPLPISDNRDNSTEEKETTSPISKLRQQLNTVSMESAAAKSTETTTPAPVKSNQSQGMTTPWDTKPPSWSRSCELTLDHTRSVTEESHSSVKRQVAFRNTVDRTPSGIPSPQSETSPSHISPRLPSTGNSATLQQSSSTATTPAGSSSIRSIRSGSRPSSTYSSITPKSVNSDSPFSIDDLRVRSSGSSTKYVSPPKRDNPAPGSISLSQPLPSPPIITTSASEVKSSAFPSPPLSSRSAAHGAAPPAAVEAISLPPPTYVPPAVPVQAFLPPPPDRKHIYINGIPHVRLGLLGRGGSSKVYKVMSQSNQLLAVKKVALSKADPVTVKGYINEIELLQRLSHSEYIIRLVNSEINYPKGYILIAMECGEIDLAHILQRHQEKPLNLNFIRMYWEQMLEAVHAIHEEKIVHSDLKPANFLLVAGSLKLIDFGIAKAIANDTTNIHREHQIGTVNYMSPEAIEDTNATLPGARKCMKLGRASDVWSLGCILYQMVYGRTPFAHLKNIYTKLRAIPDPNFPISLPNVMEIRTDSQDATAVNGEVTTPLTQTMTIPNELLSVMKNCLQRDSRQRMTIPELLQHPFLRQVQTSSGNQPKFPRLDPDTLKFVVSQVLHVATSNPGILQRNGGARDRDVDTITRMLWKHLGRTPALPK